MPRPPRERPRRRCLTSQRRRCGARLMSRNSTCRGRRPSSPSGLTRRAAAACAGSSAQPPMRRCLGTGGWYNLMQTRDLFHAIHGSERGEQAVSDVVGWRGRQRPNGQLRSDNNVRSLIVAYLQQVLQEGSPLPETSQPVSIRRRGRTRAPGRRGRRQGMAPRPRSSMRIVFVSSSTQTDYGSGEEPEVRSLLSHEPRRQLDAVARSDTHDIRNMVGMPYGLLGNALHQAELMLARGGVHLPREPRPPRCGCVRKAPQASQPGGNMDRRRRLYWPQVVPGAAGRKSKTGAHMSPAWCAASTPEQAALRRPSPVRRRCSGIGGAAIPAGAGYHGRPRAAGQLSVGRTHGTASHHGAEGRVAVVLAPNGLPVEESGSGFGLAVTQVPAFGLPVTYAGGGVMLPDPGPLVRKSPDNMTDMNVPAPYVVTGSEWYVWQPPYYCFNSSINSGWQTNDPTPFPAWGGH